MPLLSPQFASRALVLARRRARWLLRRPAVDTTRPTMFPGALRLGEEEEREVVAAVREVIRSKRLSRHTSVSGNPLQRSRVARLERRFAQRTGSRHAVAVNSGTSALVCGLAGLGVGPGDEVIVPAYTWFSTATAVLAVGAVPVIAEVDQSLTLDADDVRRNISPHTRAIIAVHMRGAPADMDALLELARPRELLVLEDAAQAAGASFRGRPVGSIGHAGAFSFEMSKTLTAGEGGMLTTNDEAVHRRAAMFHDSAAGPHLGLSVQEWLPGVNLRMSELHAAVLLVQLERLDDLVAASRARRRELEQAIAEPLRRQGVSFRTAHDPSGDAALATIFFLEQAAHVPKLIQRLQDDNVPASALYHDLAYLPQDLVDLHAYPAWAPIISKRTWSPRGGPWRGHPREVEYASDACPVTTDLLRRAIHIDISPELTPEHVRQMASAIGRAIARVL